eukprot:516365_1
MKSIGVFICVEMYIRQFKCGNNWYADSWTLTVKYQWNKDIKLQVKSSDRAEDLKAKIQGNTGIPPDQQCLLFNRRPLDNERTLKDYNIDESPPFIQLLLFGRQELRTQGY